MVPALLLFAALAAGPVRPLSPCAFGATNAIPTSSSLADQLRCYQSTERRVSIPGTSFTEGNVSGGYCVKGVAIDRFQVGRCSSFGSDAAITIPFASVYYIGDNPDLEYVTVYLVGRAG